MAVAKNPGAGQGRGGGRPRRDGARVRVAGLDLSPRAAELLRAAVEAEKVPAWAVVEKALLVALDGQAPAEAPPTPLEIQEIAQQATAFLRCHEDRPAALEALRRAWKQSLALARHSLLDAAPGKTEGA